MSGVKKKVLVIILGILILLCLNFFQKEIKGFFYSLSVPIQTKLWRGGQGIASIFDGIWRAKSLSKENAVLKLKIQKLLSEKVKLKELEKENKILRENLGIGLKEDFKLMLTDVLAKDLDQDAILINKGAKDGVLKDLPVMASQKVLLGKISEVYENFSKVMLISNKKSSFDAKISDRDLYGVAKGKGNLKLGLDLIPKDKVIKKGDLLLTASLGRTFPKGLLVGLVEEIENSDTQSFQQAKILPFFDLKTLQKVFIILDF